MCKILRMSTQDCARAVGMVQAGRGLRDLYFWTLLVLSFIKIFTLTVSKINKTILKTLQL